MLVEAAAIVSRKRIRLRFGECHGSREGFVIENQDKQDTHTVSGMVSSLDGVGSPEVARADPQRAESNTYGWLVAVARVSRVGKKSIRASRGRQLGGSAMAQSGSSELGPFGAAPRIWTSEKHSRSTAGAVHGAFGLEDFASSNLLKSDTNL